MKKITITIIIIAIIIVSTICYFIYNYNMSNNIAQRENAEYVNYLDKEVTGAEIATIINKAINKNILNKVETDNKGNYISNNKNSINIDIKFIDNDETYRMETLYNNGIDTFVQYYNSIKFKCMKIEYHKETGQVSYMYIEQASV